MPLISERRFRKYILPKSLKHDPMADRNIFDVIHSYNDFSSIPEIGFKIMCENGFDDMLEILLSSCASSGFKISQKHIDYVLNINNTSERALDIEKKIKIKNLIRILLLKGNNWKLSLDYACFHNMPTLVRIALRNKVKPVLTKHFIPACDKGYNEIVKILIEKCPNRIDNVLDSASKSGNKELIECAIKKGATDLSGALENVCLKKHTNLIPFLIEKGAEPNSVFYPVARDGLIDIIKILIEKDGNAWNSGLLGACEGSRYSIADLMIEKGGDVRKVLKKLTTNHSTRKRDLVYLIEKL